MTMKGINVTGHLWDLGNKMGYYTEAKLGIRVLY